MKKRQVPTGRGWLRTYLRDHLKLTVPLNTSDDDWQKFCEGISAMEWGGAKNAWRRHHRDEAPRYTQYVHAANEEGKRLGLFWQRLIDQEFITREDALLLAENFFQGSGGYSDEKAKEMVRKILRVAADQCRSGAGAFSGIPNKD